jgi:hypothetical protein
MDPLALERPMIGQFQQAVYIGQCCYRPTAATKVRDFLEPRITRPNFCLSHSRASVNKPSPSQRSPAMISQSSGCPFSERMPVRFCFISNMQIRYCPQSHAHTIAYFHEGKLPAGTEHRQIKYHNNVIEADHFKLKCRNKPTLGFKSIKTAYATIKGFELMHDLRKGQAKLSMLSAGIRGEVCLASAPLD